MKKILMLIIMSISLFVLIPSVNAGTASARLTTTGTSIKAGYTTTINVVIDASTNIRGGQFNLSTSNPNFEITGVSGANGLSISSNNGLYLVYKMEAGYSITTGKSIATITVKVKSGAPVGSTGVISVSNIGVTLTDAYETISAGSKAVTLTVANTVVTPPAAPKSSNNNLGSLSSTAVAIVFSASTTEYNIVVPNSVKTLPLVATAADSKATIAVAGNSTLKTGLNVVTITVTAENGTKKTYTINVNREKSNNNRLSSLVIDGYILDPVFSKKVTDYTVELKDEDITELKITYKAEDETSTVNIIGNEDLIIGRNIIKIRVTAENGETNTYNVIVDKIDPNAVSQEKVQNNNFILMIAISVVLLTFVVVQAVYIFKKRKQ